MEKTGGILILVRDLESGDITEAKAILEEASKLLEAYSRSIRNSESRIPNTRIYI